MSGELRRRLSARQMTMLALGSALGTGLFLGAGDAITTAGPAVILSFAAGAVIAAIVAMALAEMISVHPERGAFGAVAARYLGRGSGFVIRWTYWAAVVVAVGGEVTAAGIYLRFWWPQLPLWVPIVVFAVLIALVNVTNVRSFGTTEAWFAGIKVLAVVVFLLLGVLLIAFGVPGRPAVGLSQWTADGGFFPRGGLPVWLVMATVIFSFTGVELVAISAAEARDPGRSVRAAVRPLVIRLALFYVGAIAVTVALVPWRHAGEASGVAASPFVTVFTTAGIPAAASITNLVVLVAALSSANANLYAASRMIHSLGHEGFAPAFLRATNARGVPVRALLISTAGLLVAAVLAASKVAGIFTLLISMASFGVIVVWTMILASLVAFRRRGGHPEGFRMPGGPVLAVLGAVALVSVLGTAVEVPAMRLACEVGAPFCVALIVAYRVVVRRRVPASPER